MTDEELGKYLQVLLATSKMQSLWLVKDRGMPVFAHTVDVTLLSLEAFPRWQERYPDLDLAAIVVGGLLHDLSKLAALQCPGLSHSRIMSAHPTLAVEEVTGLLDQIAAESSLTLRPELAAHVKHIVASHHGRWGKVRPQTPEARLVHRCDYYSAIHHRLAPVDANDILPLLSEGCRWQQVSARLGVGRAIVKARLQESCRAEQVRHWVDLMAIWQVHGHVCVGPPERFRQLERARLVIRLARQAPDSLMAHVVPLYHREAALASLPTESHGSPRGRRIGGHLGSQVS